MSTAECPAGSGRSDRGARCLPALIKPRASRFARGFLIIAAIGALGADAHHVCVMSDRLRERTDQQIVQSHRFRPEAPRVGRSRHPGRDESVSMVTAARGVARLATEAPSLPGRVPPSASLSQDRDGIESPLPVPGRAARAVVVSLSNGGYRVTAGATTSVEATVWTLVGIGTATGIPLILALALGAVWNSRRTLASMSEISANARRIADSSEEPSERVSVATQPPRELRSTVETYNYLLRRVEEASLRSRQEESRLCDLVDAASHELRTPLTTITGFTELALIRGLDDPRRLDEAMGHVQRETRRLSSLVEDILLLARLGHGGTLERCPVDLAQLCQQAVNRAQSPGAPRTLRCVVGSFPHWVEGDRRRLEQAIDNLLANVLTHTPEETSAQLRLESDGDRHVIDVIDDGPGVAETVRDRIFEPFFRAPCSAPTDPELPRRAGRGLGLSVAAAVVTAHGGSIGLEPSERGAWFRVSLPATEGLALESSPALP